VLQHLAAARSPQNHAEVSETLVPRGYDKSTIYRCLVEMTNAGLLRRFELGDHVWRFALNRGGHSGRFDHPHFVCIACGEVSCLADARVRISFEQGGQSLNLSDLTDIVLRGRCEQCRV
jgi:Fur family transcriptional regulator, ferric uptake regulator